MIVLIEVQEGGGWQFRCGGTLVTESIVLTAAHCVAGLSPEAMRVVAGETDRSVVESEEQTRLVANGIKYPQYEGTLTSLYLHDLALLRLDVAVNVTDYVAPVTGLADEMSPDMPLECVVTGWGASGDKKSAGLLSPVLGETAVELLTLAECNRKSYWDSLVRPSQLCAVSKHTTACLGDSGGPLMCRVDGRYLQYGVTSWGTRSCRRKPVVFTRVAEYREWINATIAVL